MSRVKYADDDGFGRFGSQGMGSIALELRKPARFRVVAVTGISDMPAGAGKVAEFGWSVEGADLTRCERDVFRDQEESPTPGAVLPPLGDGQATFRLFDDGWRLSELNLQRPPHAAPVRPKPAMGD